jgi:WD40 repeat protein
MTKDFGEIFGDGVFAITLTPDNKWLFAATHRGHLKQICLETQEVVMDFGRVHMKHVTCFETTSDSKWLISGGLDRGIKRISVENKEVDKVLVQGFDMFTSLKITADGEKLLVGDQKGGFRLLSQTDGTEIDQIGFGHDGSVNAIAITSDQKFWFTSTGEGTLEQWDSKENSSFKDHGKIADSISSLCS